MVYSKYFLKDDLAIAKRGCQQQGGAMPFVAVEICRICFESDCKLYPMNTFIILDKAYQALTGCSIADGDRLPPYVCTQCANWLLNCAGFRARSLKARLKLLEIIKCHGCITIELVKSVISIQRPLSPNGTHNQSDEYDLNIEELEKMNTITAPQTNMSTENITVQNIKTEIDCAMDHSLNTECGSSLQEETDNVKVESDDLFSRNNFISGSSKFLEEVGIDDIKTEIGGVVIQGNLNVRSTSIEEDIVVDDVIADNSYIFDKDNLSVSTSSSDEEIVVDDVIERHYGTINKANLNVGSNSLPDIEPGNRNNFQEFINEEDIVINGMVCSASLYENIVSVAIKAENNYEINQYSLKDSLSDDMEKHAFMFVGEDVLSRYSPHLHKARHSSKHTARLKKVKKDLYQTKIKKPRNSESAKRFSTMYKLCYQTVTVQLVDYLKAHVTNKSCTCDMCNYRSGKTNKRASQIWAHSSEKPLSYRVGKKPFRPKGTPKIVMRAPSQKKRVSCKICMHKFRDNYNLRKHMKIHYRENPCTFPSIQT